MQEIRGSNPPAVTGICDPNTSRARHYRSICLGSLLEIVSAKTTFIKPEIGKTIIIPKFS